MSTLCIFRSAPSLRESKVVNLVYFHSECPIRVQYTIQHAAAIIRVSVSKFCEVNGLNILLAMNLERAQVSNIGEEILGVGPLAFVMSHHLNRILRNVRDLLVTAVTLMQPLLRYRIYIDWVQYRGRGRIIRFLHIRDEVLRSE